MSTYEDLVNLALYGNRRDHVFVRDAVKEVEEVISQLKREWAHELAEEIRGRADFQAGSYEWCGGVDWAANEIDPEVK